MLTPFTLPLDFYGRSILEALRQVCRCAPDGIMLQRCGNGLERALPAEA